MSRAPASPAPRPITGATVVYGIIGDPVRHTISPPMHNAAFAALGLDAVYLAFPVTPEGLAAALPGLGAAGVLGLNITVPHKTAAIPLLAELTPQARAIGAVNCLRHEAGGWLGTNTDGAGFMRALDADMGYAVRGRRVLLLGAGGSARAVGWHLLEAGASLTLANRTAANAERLAADLRRDPGGEVAVLGLDAVAGTTPHLLVNTTTVGMGSAGGQPVSLAEVGVQEAVVDIIYAPPETPLLAEARSLGLTHANGLGMLLYQGVEAFEFFTGRAAPVDVMRQALHGALAAKD